MDRLSKIIASVFYIGYLPIAPGSIGSFAALFFYNFVKDDPVVMAGSIIVCFLLGLLTAGRVEVLLDDKDASEIIIDEFTGMLIALYLLPSTMFYVVSAFLLFRFFDIVKPKPINRLEKLPGGFGIMMDDVAAGVYANLILQIIYRVF